LVRGSFHSVTLEYGRKLVVLISNSIGLNWIQADTTALVPCRALY
jgi:hypothetical protein